MKPYCGPGWKIWWTVTRPGFWGYQMRETWMWMKHPRDAMFISRQIRLIKQGKRSLG
jgi:hypothetical protein